MRSEVRGALTAAPPAQVFTCGNDGNHVRLSVDGDFLRVDVSGDALDPGIVDCFRAALAQGAVRPNMVVLVDLSDFNGRFDWASIHAIVQLAPWGLEAGRASKVAYITKSAWFSAMMKVASLLFPKTQHRQFAGAHYAMRWLQKAD